MDGNGAHTRTVLDAWRAQQADRIDPVRFRRIESLAQRASGFDGPVRRLLDARLSALIEAYALEMEARAARAVSEAVPTSSHNAMDALLDHIAQQAAERDATSQPPRTAFPELSVLADVRAIWSEVRADSQLRQSLEPASEDTGPLNSTRLVHRALTLMREASPEYLQQFLAYIDALAWLEQMQGAGMAPAEATAPAAGTRKRAPRKRTK